MLRLGNSVANDIYEEVVPSDMENSRIRPSSGRGLRDKWIVDKYVKKAFVAPCPLSQESLNKEFWNATIEGKLDVSLKRLAQGANVDYKNPDDGLRTALHKTVEKGDGITIEFLLQKLSNVDQQDANGWTALHYAAANDNVRIVFALLKRHAKADIKDNSNMVMIYVLKVIKENYNTFDRPHWIWLLIAKQCNL